MLLRISVVPLVLSFISAVKTYPHPVLERREISQVLFDQLTHFAQLSSLAYVPVCSNPLGTTLVQRLNDAATGFITRDDSNKQIILVFRGTFSVQDVLTDAQALLAPFESQGITNASDARAHSGFLSAYNSVASDVLSTVSSEVGSHPDYSLISTGHSLGGALASIAGVSLAANFPDIPLRVFTYGQPRTGNIEYAQLVESLIGTENIFRAVHTTDGIPTVVPQAIGYQHHGTEYWQFRDPPTAENVRQCDGDEDPNCSASNPSSFLSLAHITYFGQTMGSNFVSCF